MKALSRLGRLGGVIVAGPLLWVGAATFEPGPVVGQTLPDRIADDGSSIRREWALRGVVITDARTVAVLEHRPSGRQELLRVGDVVAGGGAIAAITADRVVLDAEGREVTLRLGHGGLARMSRPVIRPRASDPRWNSRRNR